MPVKTTIKILAATSLDDLEEKINAAISTEAVEGRDAEIVGASESDSGATASYTVYLQITDPTKRA